MKPRIAIPVPHSNDLAYSQRSWPQYAETVERSGGEAVKIPLDLSRPQLPTGSIAARAFCCRAAEPTSIRRSTAKR